jgi:hypothetical protein
MVWTIQGWTNENNCVQAGKKFWIWLNWGNLTAQEVMKFLQHPPPPGELKVCRNEVFNQVSTRTMRNNSNATRLQMMYSDVAYRLHQSVLYSRIAMRFYCAGASVISVSLKKKKHGVPLLQAAESSQMLHCILCKSLKPDFTHMERLIQKLLFTISFTVPK